MTNETGPINKKFSRRTLLTTVIPGAAAAGLLAACGGEEPQYIDVDNQFRKSRDELVLKLRELGDFEYASYLRPFFQDQLDEIGKSVRGKLKLEDQRPIFEKAYPVFSTPSGERVGADGGKTQPYSLGHFSDELFQSIIAGVPEKWEHTQSKINNWRPNNLGMIDDVEFTFVNIGDNSGKDTTPVLFVDAFSHNPKDNRWYPIGFENGASITDSKYKRDIVRVKTSTRLDGRSQILSTPHDKIVLVASNASGRPLSIKTVNQVHPK